MDKVKQSTKNVTPFGGLNFIYDAIIRYGISVWLDQQIGYRSALALVFIFRYSAVIVWQYIGTRQFCGRSTDTEGQVCRSGFPHDTFARYR